MLSSGKSISRTSNPQRWNSSAVEIVILLLATVIFWLVAGIFARSQSIWVDETTQLVGLAQTYRTSIEWLAGSRPEMPAVPFDRMPPLSYVIGIAWASVFGLTENSMRAMGVFFASAAIPALYLSGRLVGGRLAGAFAVVFVMFSANILGLSSEIRAYPIYFAAIAWATYAYCNLVILGNSARYYLILVIFLLLSMYLHFYGCVAVFCFGISLLIVRLINKETVVPVIGWFALLGIASLGLLPFIFAATELSAVPDGASGDGGVAAVVRATARLVYRMVAHPVYEIIPLLRWGHLLIVGLLVCIAGLALFRSPRKLPVALLLPLAIGFVFLAAVDFAVAGFDVQAPHYNIWMLPLAALFLTVSIFNAPRLLQSIGSVLLVCLMITTVLGSTLLLRNSGLYSNGPGDWAVGQIDGPGPTLVIHTDNASWASLYFPLVYAKGDQVEQWLRYEDGRLARLVPGAIVSMDDSQADLSRFARVFDARSFSLDAKELATIARGDISCAQAGGATTDVSTEHSYCAFFGATLVERKQ